MEQQLQRQVELGVLNSSPGAGPKRRGDVVNERERRACGYRESLEIYARVNNAAEFPPTRPEIPWQGHRGIGASAPRLAAVPVVCDTTRLQLGSTTTQAAAADLFSVQRQWSRS
jgi:hypothetical protein